MIIEAGHKTGGNTYENIENNLGNKAVEFKLVNALVNSMIYFHEQSDKMEEYAGNSYQLSNEYDIRINSIRKMKSLGWK